MGSPNAVPLIEIVFDGEAAQSADPNLGRSRGQENVIIVDTDKDSSSSTFFFTDACLYGT